MKTNKRNNQTKGDPQKFGFVYEFLRTPKGGGEGVVVLSFSFVFLFFLDDDDDKKTTKRLDDERAFFWCFDEA